MEKTLKHFLEKNVQWKRKTNKNPWKICYEKTNKLLNGMCDGDKLKTF